jgi:uncharacterized protein YggU (UPF0235/DUF167 family)
VSLPGRADVRFAVRLTPRGGLDRVDGVFEGTLRVRVAAPPVDDAANRGLLRLIARELDVPVGAVRLVAGATARAKVVSVDGVPAERIRARWPDLQL